MKKSEIIFKDALYTAYAMKNGALLVTKNRKKEGRCLVCGAASYINDIRTAVDRKEASALRRALFIS